MFLPSHVMRIHGAKQQREAVKRTPKNQLEPVFEVGAFFGLYACVAQFRGCSSYLLKLMLILFLYLGPQYSWQYQMEDKQTGAQCDRSDMG